MGRNGTKWDEMEEIFYSKQNSVMEHFLVGIISIVNFEVTYGATEVAKTEIERCSDGP